MGRITSFSKQVIVFFLVTALIIRPTFAANFGGWTMSNSVAQGASTVYTGTKNVIINGADYIKKGTAKITPPASGVAKVLARGVAGYALSVAVEQLLGSVDWVLDPANNRVKYFVDPDVSDPDHPSNPKIWVVSHDKSVKATSREELAKKYCAQQGYSKYSLSGSVSFDCSDGEGNSLFVSAQTITNPAYDPQAEPEREEKSIPLEVVAQKVISNANAGDGSAQQATTAAAADIVSEAEKDDAKARPIVGQLEASAKTTPADAAAAANAGTGTATATPQADPVTGEQAPPTDITLEFPIFCNWAPSVCEAAQVVISFPQTLTDWWNTGKTKAEQWATAISEAWTKVKEEYADKPTENTDTQLDLPDQSDPNINTDLSFGGSCPASRSVPVSFAGIHTEIEFSFQWFCEVASIAKPVVISISAFAAALIVAGVRTEDD